MIWDAEVRLLVKRQAERDERCHSITFKSIFQVFQVNLFKLPVGPTSRINTDNPQGLCWQTVMYLKEPPWWVFSPQDHFYFCFQIIYSYYLLGSPSQNVVFILSFVFSNLYYLSFVDCIFQLYLSSVHLFDLSNCDLIRVVIWKWIGYINKISR